MNTWFEVCVKYAGIDQESGKDVTKNEWYLFDAVSFTEAEARTYEEMKALTSGEVKIDKIKRGNFSDVLPFEDGEYWFVLSVEFVVYDEASGKEKKALNKVLIMADDIEHALRRLKESFKDMTVPYLVKQIGYSKILDIYPYFKQDENEPEEHN